ncbi:MAG: acetate kinase [Planctomycetes bacterium]|nr:acetate kinase [Planctomycetota bacterium]
MVKILVINSGSSSLKCSLFSMPASRKLANFHVERIGEEESSFRFESETNQIERSCDAPDHSSALQLALETFISASGPIEDLDEIAAVGHRVVHGGEKVSESVAVDDKVLSVIRENISLAPLHNPPNLTGLEAAMNRLPDRLQVAVFDTAFHQSMPEKAFLYAIPYELYEKDHVRRYGFHGTSHGYVAERAAKILGKPFSECDLITMHLGNGCSAAAISHGKSVDTSMGLTPLEGLVMGTRCGDIDPALSFHFTENLGMNPREVYDLLNRRSGLEGLSGVSNDMRELSEASETGNHRAQVAMEVFCYRAKKYIGAYMAALGRLDAVIFTAGIGENSARVRKMICSDLENLGIELDEEKNRKVRAEEAALSTESSPVSILCVPTDEALKIAMDTFELYKRQSQ